VLISISNDSPLEHLRGDLGTEGLAHTEGCSFDHGSDMRPLWNQWRALGENGWQGKAVRASPGMLPKRLFALSRNRR